jgi:hypothetical protein
VHDLFEAALQKKTSYLPRYASLSTRYYLNVTDVLYCGGSATGMVWSTCEEIQKIPMSNKVSYRRAFMEVSEMKYYLHESALLIGQ